MLPLHEIQPQIQDKLGPIDQLLNYYYEEGHVSHRGDSTDYYWEIIADLWNELDSASKFLKIVAGWVQDLDAQGEWFNDMDLTTIRNLIKTDFDIAMANLQITLAGIQNTIGLFVAQDAAKVIDEVGRRIDDVERIVVGTVNNLVGELAGEIAAQTALIMREVQGQTASIQDELINVAGLVRKFLDDAPEDIAFRIWKYFRDFFFRKVV